jgi:hypothetical protein
LRHNEDIIANNLQAILSPFCVCSTKFVLCPKFKEVTQGFVATLFPVD